VFLDPPLAVQKYLGGRGLPVQVEFPVIPNAGKKESRKNGRVPLDEAQLSPVHRKGDKKGKLLRLAAAGEKKGPGIFPAEDLLYPGGFSCPRGHYYVPG
jgi:hypothetical protein